MKAKLVAWLPAARATCVAGLPDVALLALAGLCGAFIARVLAPDLPFLLPVAAALTAAGTHYAANALASLTCRSRKEVTRDGA